MPEYAMEGKEFEKRRQKALDALGDESRGKRVPVIVLKSRNARIAQIPNKRFLVPIEITVGQFMVRIRQSISLAPEECIFIFVNNCIPSNSATIGELYEEHRKADLYLYLTYTEENVYG